MLTCGSASAPSPKKLDEANANLDRLTKNLEVCDHGVTTERSTLIRNGKTYSIIPGMICSVDIKNRTHDQPLSAEPDQQGT